MLFLKDKNKERSLIIFKVYVVNDKKYFTYSTGVNIKVSEWDLDKNNPIVKKGEVGKNNARISGKLSNFTSFYQLLINDVTFTITKDALKNKFDERFKKIHAVIEFAEYPSDFLDDFLKDKRIKSISDEQSIVNYTIHYKVFQEFESKTNKYRFEEINEELFPIYLNYLRESKDYKDSTLHTHFSMLRSFWDWIYKKKNQVKLYESFTYKNREPDKIALTENDLEILRNLSLEDKALEKARDVFLIGCYSGQRFSDYSVFEKSDIRNNMIVKFSEKTEIQAYIPLHSKLKTLLEKYNYKLPDFQYSYKFNKYIRKVCKIAEFNQEYKIVEYKGNSKEVIFKKKWQLITSHTARRTFITISSNKGMPDKIIMGITGIKDIETLHKYKKINANDYSEAIKIWE